MFSFTTVHTGNPGVEKSKKFISLNIAIVVGVKTDLVGARLSMVVSIIKIRRLFSPRAVWGLVISMAGVAREP